MAPIFLKRRGQVGGHGVGPDPQSRIEREIAIGGPGLHQHPVHGRHADEHGGPALLDGVEHLDGPEAGHHVDGHTETDHADEHGEAHDVGDGQAEHGLVAVQGRGPQRSGRGRPDEALVGQLGALGPARRARGVEERGHVARTGRERLDERIAAVDLVDAAHHDAGLGVGLHVSHLVGAHLRVDGHRDAPGTRCGQAQQEQLVVVGGVDDDPVTRVRPGPVCRRPSG